MFRRRVVAAAFTILILSRAGPAVAQQSSFSPDVAAPAHLDLSFDFIGSVARHPAGGFEWYFPDASVGLGRGVELGAGWSSTVSTEPASQREWLPHAKWQFLENDRVTLAAATEWHLPLDAATGDRYGLAYLSGSHEFGGRWPVTVNAGVYTLLDRVPSGDTRHGISVGWEQEVRHGWALALDWTSGDNWYGYFSSGVTFDVGGQSMFAGYCRGNDPKANHGPCMNVSRTF